jgi:hypothetical protein
LVGPSLLHIGLLKSWFFFSCYWQQMMMSNAARSCPVATLQLKA